MKSIVIEPNQLLKIKKIQIFLGISIFFLLSGFILFTVYVAQIKSKITQFGEKIYLPNSKIPLYVSISSFAVSLITTLFSLWTYEKIFQNFPSKTRNWLFFLIAITIIGIIVDIIFIVKKFNFCPKNQEYSNNLNKCVDICPLGSYPNMLGNCTSGCVVNSNCTKDEICLNGTCCNMNTHTNVDGTCCPNKNVQNDGGTQYCCSKRCGTECCIGDEKFSACSDDGQNCVAKCGEQACNVGETCLIYPNFESDDPLDKIYKCYQDSDNCNPDTAIQNYPPAIANFYPAYNGSENNCKDDSYLQTFLDSTDYTNGENAIECIKDEQKNDGFICGIPNTSEAVRFQQKKFTSSNDQKCTDYQKCMNEVHYPQTSHLQINETDDGLICNQILNVNKNSNLVSLAQDASYQTIRQNSKINDIISFEQKSTRFCPDGQKLDNNGNCCPYGEKLDKDGNCPNISPPSNEILCSDVRKYSPDCNDFKDCTGDECPFEDSDGKYYCPANSSRKYIQSKAAYPSKCTVNNGSFTCSIISKDYEQYKDNINCKNQNDCDMNRKANNRNYNNMSRTCIPGESFWESPLPDSGITKMKYDNYGGGYATGGNCDLKKEVKDKIGNDFPCPPGTKPYFWARKKETPGNKQCGGYHNAYYSRIDYACCDDNQFTLTDKDNGHNAPENKNYCIGPKNGAASNDNFFSLANNDKTSIIIGRGKTNNDPVSNTNTCNVSAEKGLDKLQNLMNHMNQDIWKN